MERKLKVQEKELKEEFNETISLNQKMHKYEVENIRIVHDQEATILKGEYLYINK